MTRPALLLDVDGVLNPSFRCKPPYCRCHPTWVKRRAHPDGLTYKLVLNPAHGPALLRLAADAGAELMWATFWEGHANVWVGPHVGLPKLPVVPMPPHPPWGRDSAATLGAWKLKNVLAHLGDRPFVWFDDDANQPFPLGQYLVKVDEATGLTDAHLAKARALFDQIAELDSRV